MFDAFDDAFEAVNEKPDDPQSLYALAKICVEAQRYGFAKVLVERALGFRETPAGLNSLGMILESERKPGSRQLFLKAFKMDPKATYASNVGMTWLREKEWEKALHWADKALAIDPEAKGAKSVRAFGSLALGDWGRGWDDYEALLGGEFRKRLNFVGEPLWDGSKGKTVIVYGEQGLGDEIMFASMIPDAVRDCKKVILECDPRLEGLFKRSFPEVDVYGTRRMSPVEWPMQYQIDASVPAGGLGRFYRRSPEACPRTPYLVADPDKRKEMRQWLGSGRKIGLTWSGGTKRTEQAEREMGLKALKPFMDANPDAEFISLQYKPCESEGVRVHPKIEANVDYDDAAALVAELDLVVGVHTSAHHLAGALGRPTLTFVPTIHSWYYQSDTFPFYPLTLFRQRKGEAWIDTVRRACS